jgi:hypothetical protein
MLTSRLKKTLTDPMWGLEPHQLEQMQMIDVVVSRDELATSDTYPIASLLAGGGR